MIRIDLHLCHQAPIKSPAQIGFVDVDANEDKFLPPIPIGVIPAVEDTLLLP